MSFAETTSRTLPPLSAALGHSSSAIHPGSLQSHLLPTVFLPNYGAAQSLQPHSALPLQHPPATPASYLVTAKPQYQAAAATVAAIPQQTSLQPAQPIPVPVRTTSTILPKIGADYASPPPSLLPSPSIRDFPDPRISPTLTSVSSNLSGSPPSHSYYPQPSSSSEHHGHHHHHHHHHSQPHSPGHHHYGTSPSSHNGGHRAGSVQPSPDEVLAEKRRRNAGASARFRDRRKQREREAQDKCQYLERRVHELEDALAHATGGVLPERERKKRGRASKGGNGMSTNGEHRKESLAGRVSDLENQVVGTRIERESAYRRIQELEKESKYLRSLLSDNPNVLPRSSFTSSSSQFSNLPRSSYDDRDRDHDRDHDSDTRPNRDHDSDTRPNRSPPYHSETKSRSRSSHHYTSYRPYPIDIPSSRSWEPSGSQSPRTTSTMSVTSDDGDRSSNGSLSSPQ